MTYYDSQYNIAGNKGDHLDTVYTPFDQTGGFTVTGDLYEDYDAKENKMKLYAGWQANTYEVRYYYGDNASDKSALGSSPVESITVADKLVAAEKAEEVLTATVVFDKYYDAQYLNRVGYTFLGWTLYGFTYELDENGKVKHPDDLDIVYRATYSTNNNEDKFILNKDAITIEGLKNSGYYMNTNLLCNILLNYIHILFCYFHQ
jgi:hypothetical protein